MNSLHVHRSNSPYGYCSSASVQPSTQTQAAENSSKQEGVGLFCFTVEVLRFSLGSWVPSFGRCPSF